MTLTALPTPPPDRWQPTRAGLVALWRFWDETFTFHNGRLLLRGPNGAGKSMALELLLPFLLDADASPGKLSSAAKSRGGLFERIMTGTDEPSRTGFAWVEFRRGAEVFTLGARMRASAATRRYDLDFFTTSQAVGDDLHLLDGHRVPLSRKALVDAIGEHGRVHASAEEHRTAVRETLFPGFGPERYSSVITALLALRREKLSQNLDLDKLSEVLSEALPPLDEHDLAVVAEGFERLDRRKAELAALEAELTEIRALAARQRDYARAVVAGLAGDVRAAESRRDGVTRAEREARDQLTTVRGEAAAVQTEIAAISERLAALDVQIDALRDSGAYREGAKLDDLRAYARQLGEHLARLERSADERARAMDEAGQDHAAAQADLDTATANRELATADLRRAATRVGADAVVTETEQIDDAAEGEALVRGWLSARRSLIDEIRRALGEHTEAIGRRAFQEGRVGDDVEKADRWAVEHAARTVDRRAAVEAYATAVTEWAAASAAIGAERASQALPARADEPAAVTAAVASLGAELHAEHAVALQDVSKRRDAALGRRGDLSAERSLFAEGRLVEPAPPEWRSDRSGRLGAPLWRLVDVTPGVDNAAIDRLEAALTASTILDAWIAPDGHVDLGDDRADVFLSPRRVDGPSLADWLTPLEGAAVAIDVVTAVLRSISVMSTVAASVPDDGLVLGLDGTFQVGAASGRGALGPAALLGAAAQDRRRLARLAELDAEIAALDGELEQLDRERGVLQRHQAAVGADLAALPSGSQVEAAARAEADAAARRAEADDRLAASRHDLAAAEDGVRRAVRALTSLGARHQLPTEERALADVEQALADLERATATRGRRTADCWQAERAHNRAAARADRARADALRATDDRDAAGRDVADVSERVATLESTIGQDYRDVLARLDALNGERRGAHERRRQRDHRRPELERRIGRLESAVEEAEAARVRADDERALSHRRFVVAVTDGLAADASVVVPELLDGVTAILSAARSVAADLFDRDDQLTERANRRVDEQLHQTRSRLGGRVDFSRELTDNGWWKLTAFSAGIRRRAGELSDAFGGDLEQARAEFVAEEERLFEQVLAGSVRRALAGRIRLANRLVDGVNDQLAKVRTAAGGVAVRLRWDVDADQLEAVKAARALLLRDPGDLSEEETSSLQAFVRARVDQARAELEANATWEARLRETLDYRSWHRFTLQLAHRDWEGYQPATNRRLQRLSTGERSIALHLPMLASIAAHYADDDGGPSGCPRLILLDELFAGVDSANRAQLFGTFTDWDLDAVFTSDHEWCQYATLDGIAIHHLHPPAGDDPVTTTRFTWDGRQRTIDPTAA